MGTGFTDIARFGPSRRIERCGLRKLASEAIDASLVWHPLDATGAGLHDYDGQLPDYSKPAIAAVIARLDSCQAKCKALDPASLGERNRYDRLIILAGLHRDLFWLRDARRFSTSPMSYIPDAAVFIQQNFAARGADEIGDRD